ncbi:MAG: NERD domain-containing protein [Rubrobacter sp.]|nr:NERD domain-containing protein [Rubrobacter sp.]
MAEPNRPLKKALYDLFHPFEAAARRRERERRDREQREREEQRARARREESGKKAENRTQRELQKLTWRGTYYIFYDLPTLNAGNIDHLVVGPEGITLVETKGNWGTVEGVPTGKREGEITVGGNPLHRSLRNQIRAQMWDVCKRAGMKTGPDDTSGMNWIVCFPNGELGQGMSQLLRSHMATTDDLCMKMRAMRTGQRRMDDEMVEAVASAVSRIYERPPSATPARRPDTDDERRGREGEDQ